MKQLTFLLFLIFALACQPTQNEEYISTASLYWLVGHWESNDSDSSKSGFEVWENDGEERMRGLGVTMNFGDTVFTERLEIINKDNILFYVAEVDHNPAPVLFQIQEIRPDGFVCVNDSHDFPKKIEYRVMQNQLQVKISGDGKSSNFSFTKIQ